MRQISHLSEAMLRQRGHLFTWVPVFLGLGIAFYMSALQEPGQIFWLGAGVCAVLLLLMARQVGVAFSPLLVALVLVFAGGGLAALRTWQVEAPVLGYRYYGPVEGRILKIDRSASAAPRVTLDQVVLYNTPVERTPETVRISLVGEENYFDAEPGTVIIVTAHLSPPSGPVEPGDFDFRRHAWFIGLGAVGYARTPALMLEQAQAGQPEVMLHRLRNKISIWIQAKISGDAGGFAAAVTTGDRAGLTPQASDNLRGSNLYHLVSISGMHMGILTGFVFMLARAGVAFFPSVALRFSSKKFAALVALPAAAFYLALAGRAVPTERAFVMAAMALVAILLDRRAISLRTVAAAALVVLVFRPESLVSAGFQMSFSAVVALIWIFGSVGMLRADPQSKWRWILPVAMLILSSLVAGTATAPFAAAHFNRVALYGLVANLLAVPAMGFLVMPGAVILALTAPLGLEAPALFMIEIGSRWILFVADQVANAPGAVSAVITPPPIVLPLIALGGLFIVLWRGKERWLGLAALACAFYLWTGAQRPALLVAESGSLIGLLTEDGRALSRDRADGYAASSWLENDGTINSQAEAAELPGLGPQHGLRGRVLRFELAGNTIMQVRGKMALAEVRGCDGAQIMILTVADEAEGRPCQVWDTDYLRETGALAINIVDGKLEVVSALEQAGARPWTR